MAARVHEFGYGSQLLQTRRNRNDLSNGSSIANSASIGSFSHVCFLAAGARSVLLASSVFLGSFLVGQT